VSLDHELAWRTTRSWRERARKDRRVIKGYTITQGGRISGAKLCREGVEDVLFDVSLAIHAAMTELPHRQPYFESVYARVVQARADLHAMKRTKRTKPTPLLDKEESS
jgi:hypothetical protein